MDITKADWQKLTGEVGGISSAVRDVQHQLQTLGDRTIRLEDFHKEIKPNMWFVTGARAIVAVFGLVVVVGIISGAFWLGSLSSDVRHQGDAISEIKRSIEDLQRSNRRLADAVEKLPKVNFAHLRTYEGRLESAKDGEIRIVTTLLSTSQRFTVSPEATISVGGKPARFVDLKTGMLVLVTTMPGEDSTAISVQEITDGKRD